MSVAEHKKNIKVKIVSMYAFCSYDSSSLHHREEKPSGSLYMDKFNDIAMLAGRFSSIDQSSIEHIKRSENFKSFLEYSLNVIESKHGYFQTKLESFIDEDEENFRFTYYLKPTYSSLISEQNVNAADNIIYDKLIKNLSKRDQQLQLEMVLDERPL